MKNVFKSPKTYMVAGLVIVVITASAWQLKDKKRPGSDTTTNNHADGDTTKPRKHGNDTAYNGMKRYDDDSVNINIDLSGLDTTINETVREALSNIDVKAIVDQAMEGVKQVDWEAINTEINQSLKNAQEEIKHIDIQQIDREIKQAMDEANSREIKDALDSTKLKQIIRDALREVKININGGRRI